MLYNNNIFKIFLTSRISLKDCIFYYKQNPLILLNFFSFLLKLNINYRINIISNLIRLIFFGFFIIIFHKKFSFWWYSFYIKRIFLTLKKINTIKFNCINFLYTFYNIFNNNNILKFNKNLTFKEVFIKALKKKKKNNNNNNYYGYNNYWFKNSINADVNFKIVKIFSRFFNNKNYNNSFDFKGFNFTKMTSSVDICLKAFIKEDYNKYKKFMIILKEFLNWDLDPLKILNFFKIFKVISISNPRKIINFIEYFDPFILSLPYNKRLLFFYLRTIRIDNLTNLYHIIRSFNRFLDMIHYIKDVYEAEEIQRKNILITRNYFLRYLKKAKMKLFNYDFIKNFFWYCVNLSENMFLKKNKIYFEKSSLKISLLNFFNKTLSKKVKFYLKSFYNNFSYSKIKKLFFYNFEFFLLLLFFYKFYNLKIYDLKFLNFSFKFKTKNFFKKFFIKKQVIDNLNFKSFLLNIKDTLNPDNIGRKIKSDKIKYNLRFIIVLRFLVYFYLNFEFFLFWFSFFNKYFFIFFSKIFVNFWFKIFYYINMKYYIEMKKNFNVVVDFFEYKLYNFSLYNYLLYNINYIYFFDVSTYLIIDKYLYLYLDLNINIDTNYDYRSSYSYNYNYNWNLFDNKIKK